MPLTQEQFQKARQSGFSTEQIIGFEKKRIGEQPQIPQQTQDVSPIDKAINIIGQFGRRAYETTPFAKRLAQITGTPAEEIYSTLPKPKGITEQFAAGLGAIAPDLAMSIPFMKGARLLPKLPQIAKSALGFGAYGGAKAAIQKQPILPSALSSAGSAALFHAGGKLGATAIPKFIPGAERIGSALGGGITGKVMGGEESMALGAGLGALYPATRIQPTEQTTKMAETLVNYVLKPSKTLKEFGKSPARAVVREGLWGRNIADLDNKTQIKLSELNTYKDRLKFEAKNIGIKVDLTKNKAFEPIGELITELNKAPESHKATIKALQTNLNDLTNRYKNLNNLTIDEAYELRDIVNSLKPSGIFSRQSEAMTSKALHQTYHNIAEAINNSGISPNLKTTNKRISDLISLKEAINDASNRNPSYWRILPFPLMVGYALKGPLGVVSGLATLAAETTAGATGISKMIGKKYPKIK